MAPGWQILSRQPSRLAASCPDLCSLDLNSVLTRPNDDRDGRDILPSEKVREKMDGDGTRLLSFRVGSGILKDRVIINGACVIKFSIWYHPNMGGKFI